jgi:hypothetical protein
MAAQVKWIVGLRDKIDEINRPLAIQETPAHLRLLQERWSVTTVKQGGLILQKATGKNR